MNKHVHLLVRRITCSLFSTFWKCFFLFCLFVLYGVYRPTCEFFTHMETSQLPVNGCKFWLLLGTHGHRPLRVLFTCRTYMYLCRASSYHYVKDISRKLYILWEKVLIEARRAENSSFSHRMYSLRLLSYLKHYFLCVNIG